MLARSGGYWEGMWSGAALVAAADPAGREGAAAGIVRHAREAAGANGPVFACVLMHMSLLSEARFTLQSTADKHLFGNTGLALLEYPWPGATTGEMLARMTQDATTAGNAYLRKVRPADGSGTHLMRMRPDTVTIVSEEKADDQGRVYKEPVGYEEDLSVLGVSDRAPQHYGVDEVAHFSPIPDPGANWKGMSWLSPILREVGADNSLTEYKTAHVRRGATPGLVIKYQRKLNDVALDSLKKRFAALYGGPENAGKTLVLDEGADVTVAGSTLEQLQFEAVQAAGVKRVCAAAGPGLDVILGFEPGDYQSAIRRFADLWARPMWRSACACLQHLVEFVDPRSGAVGPVSAPARLWYDVDGIAALREGELERSQATLVRMQAVSAAVAAGYTRESAIAAADSGDISQLAADPAAAAGQVNTRRPQAGVPEALPGVVAPNLPNAYPLPPETMPALPNGARG